MSYMLNWLGNLFTGAADGTSSVEVPTASPSLIPEAPPLPPFITANTEKAIAAPPAPELPIEEPKVVPCEFYGPARNAPNQGLNIKATLTQAPILVIPITQADLRTLISKLRPTKINANPPIQVDRPGLAALKSVFEQGTLEYLKSRSEKNLFV